MAGVAPVRTAVSPPPGYFTADEVDLADVLVFLQDSSTSTGDTGGTPTAGEGSSVAFAVSGSSSPRSVNAPPVPEPAPARQPAPRGLGGRGDAVDEEDEQEVAGSPRRIKRWRPIAEIYRSTQRIGRRSVKNKE
ncbi:hypothetical protein PR202_ga16493 [Eleusine coracana subsp. coracana]|uniref:Uncharacterized protein n=1 Tax=Eleusine coracana subsp. coracana TaxID=191504 RepID=A0AAV5CMY5_ELECO|nr:hypothetical protein PR202_ga16493 [Eleusine coracana subsp. coracana]